MNEINEIREQANKLYNDALDAEDNQQIEEAIRLYEEALALCSRCSSFPADDSGLIATQNNLAALLLNSVPAQMNLPHNSRFERARQLYQSSVDLNPHNIIAVLGLARCAFDVGEYDEAIRLYKLTILDLENASPSSKTTTTTTSTSSSTSLENNNSNDSFNHLFQPQENAVQLAVALEGLGFSYLACGRNDDAEAVFLKAIAGITEEHGVPRTEFTGPYFGLAQISLAAKRFTQTVSYCCKVLTIDPNYADPTLYFLMAVGLDHGKRWADANAAFLRGQRLLNDDNQPPAWLRSLLRHRFEPEAFAAQNSRLDFVRAKARFQESKFTFIFIILVIILSFIGIFWLLQNVNMMEVFGVRFLYHEK